METAYRLAIDWLFGTQYRGIKLGLDNVRRLLTALGEPQNEARFIHVAGTNGKGSVCAMIPLYGSERSTGMAVKNVPLGA